MAAQNASTGFKKADYGRLILKHDLEGVNAYKASGMLSKEDLKDVEADIFEISLYSRTADITHIHFLVKHVMDPSDIPYTHEYLALALNLALFRDNWDAILLLSNYVKLNVSTESLGAPLHMAINHENLDAMKFFLAQGAHIDMEDHYHTAPLLLAVDKQNIDAVKLLLDYGADVNIKSSPYQKTALHEAIRLNNLEITKVLLSACADPFIEDVSGLFPVDQAQRTSGEYMLTLLNEYSIGLFSFDTVTVMGDDNNIHRYRPKSDSFPPSKAICKSIVSGIEEQLDEGHYFISVDRLHKAYEVYEKIVASGLYIRTDHEPSEAFAEASTHPDQPMPFATADAEPMI